MDANQKLVDLFDQALEFTSAAERERFLDQTCEHEPGLRSQVEVLLQAHQSAGNFLHPDGVPGDADGPTAEPPCTERPGDRIGHYRIVAQLGEGGFSTVHLARQDVPLCRWVALKVLKPGMDTRQVVARFEMERQALAAMDHPGIAKVFDAGATPGGRPYFVMEYVPGVEITRFADSSHASVQVRLNLFCQVCEAVLHAHQKGIIHRDIKPSNILLAQYREQVVPKVIDFGIARVTRPLLRDVTPFTCGGRFLGTPAYMSPEQARMGGPELDTRTDIYSLGALLYVLLTGRPPFDHEVLMQAGLVGMAEIICRQEPQRPSARLNQMPKDDLERIAAARGTTAANLPRCLAGDLDGIVLKALEKERDRRYATAASLAEDIRRHLDQRPVLAAAPTLSYRLCKFMRRNRIAVAAGAGIATLLIASTVVSAYMAVRARVQRVAAVTAAQRAQDSVVDKHVAAGLSASSRGDFGHALLQFAHAASLAEPASQGMEINRVRTRIWARFASFPLRAFEASPGLHELSFNPTRPLLMALTKGRPCSVWDWRANQALAWVAETGPAQAAAWGADGNLLTLLSTTGTVQVRRLPHGETVHVLTLPAAAAAVAHSPDGRWLAVGGDSVRLYALSDGSLHARWDLPAAVTSLLFSPASDRLVTAGSDGWARVWDVPPGAATGYRPVATLPHRNSIRMGACIASNDLQEDSLKQPHDSTLAFFDDGRGLITRSDTYAITCWQIDTGEALHRIEGLCCSCNFTLSPNGEALASGVRDGQVGVWNLATGQLRGPFLSHGDCVFAMAFGPEGNTLFTGGADHTSCLWSLAEGQRITTSLRHFDDIMNVAASAQLGVLATAQSDGLVRVWQTTAPGPAGRRLAYPDGPKRVRSQGLMVVATTEPAWTEHLRQTRLYRADTGEGIGPVLSLADNLQDVALSPDERTLAVLEHPAGQAPGGTLRFLEATTGNLLYPPMDLPARPAALSWRLDGRGVGVVCEGDEIAVVHLQEEPGIFWLATEPRFGDQANPQILFSPDGTLLASLGSGGGVRVWDLEARRLRHPPLQPDHSACWSMSMSPDGANLVTTTTDGFVTVWDLNTGSRAAPPLIHPTWVYHAAFSPDGTQLLTAGHDRQVRLWDWRRGIQISSPFVHPFEVYDAAFTPDGRWVLTTCRLGTVRIWDSLQGAPVTPFIKVGTQAFNAEVTPDGRHAIFGSLGPGLQVLDLGILYEEDPRSSLDFILLGEVSAGSEIVQGRERVLTSSKWLEKYRQLQAIRPEWIDARFPTAEAGMETW